MRAAAIAMLVLVAGCAASGAPVLPAEKATAEAAVRLHQSPLAVVPVALWHANDQPGSMLCGEIEAPPALQRYRKTLRYILDPARPEAMVEPHELLVATDPRGSALLGETRGIFDNLWANACIESAPLSRRVAAWWNGTDEAAPVNAPISNAYVDGLLKRRSQ